MCSLTFADSICPETITRNTELWRPPPAILETEAPVTSCIVTYIVLAQHSINFFVFYFWCFLRKIIVCGYVRSYMFCYLWFNVILFWNNMRGLHEGQFFPSHSPESCRCWLLGTSQRPHKQKWNIRAFENFTSSYFLEDCTHWTLKSLLYEHMD